MKNLGGQIQTDERNRPFLLVLLRPSNYNGSGISPNHAKAKLAFILETGILKGIMSGSEYQSAPSVHNEKN